MRTLDIYKTQNGQHVIPYYVDVETICILGNVIIYYHLSIKICYHPVSNSAFV